MAAPVFPPARYPIAALAILWTSGSLIFPSSFCRRAFSPAPVSPFVIPVPASLDNLTTGLMFGANFQDEYTIEVTLEEPKVALAELVYSLKEVTE